MTDDRKALLQQQGQQFHMVFSELWGRRRQVRQSLADCFRIARSMKHVIQSLKEAVVRLAATLEVLCDIMEQDTATLNTWSDRTETDMARVLHAWRN